MSAAASRFTLLALLALAGCGQAARDAVAGEREAAATGAGEGTATAVFAGGCFWCMEPPYDELPGVIDTTSGYAGGTVENPSYKQVTAGGTGHLEVVRVTYDPGRVGYAELLETFWRNVDPLDDGGQFCDRGDSYRTAIFYADPKQEALARESKAAVAEQLDAAVVTELRPLGSFYPAERYHQNYYRKNPIRYKFYRTSCGRDRRLAELWGR